MSRSSVGLSLWTFALFLALAVAAVPVVTKEDDPKKELKEPGAKRVVFEPRVNFDDTVSVEVGSYRCFLHYRAYGTPDESWALTLKEGRRGGAFCSLFRVAVKEGAEKDERSSGVLWQGFAAYIEKDALKQPIKQVEVYDTEGLLLQEDDYSIEEGVELRNYPGWSKQLEQFTIEV